MRREGFMAPSTPRKKKILGWGWNGGLGACGCGCGCGCACGCVGGL